MHIAFVNNTRKWGGVKTWTLAMARSACKAGHQATVFGQDDIFVAKAQSSGLTGFLYRPGPDYNPVAIAYYAQYFKRHHVDVVVANVGKDLRTAGIAAKILGIPLIHRVGAPNDFRDTWRNRIEAAVLSPSYLCCSQFVLDHLRRNVSFVSQYPGIAIHPGVEILLKADYTRHEPLQLVTTSRLSEDKCHKMLLQAVRLLLDDGYIFGLTIVGTGPMQAELEAYVADNHMQSVVKFTGFTTDVSRWLKQSDIFILPTRSEPLGIALEEAMAHGLLPVARRAGGVPEIWPPHLDHLLLDPQSDATDFASLLKTVLTMNEADLTHARHNVYEHAASSFSQEGQYSKFMKWIEQTVICRRTL